MILHHIFLLYCPPTSNKAVVIWPNEQCLQASIRTSKIFSWFMAAFWICCSDWEDSFDLFRCKLSNILIWYFFSSSVALITSSGTIVGEPLEFKNVFTPFFRLDKSRSLNKSGVGLGLAIVEDIINSHGGNIQLGKSKFNGLQVKISLPF